MSEIDAETASRIATEEVIDFRPVIEDEDTEVMLSVPTRSRRRLIVTLIIVLIVILGSIGGGLYYFQQAGQSPVQYQQLPAQIGNLSVKVSGSGPISPRTAYNLNFGEAGQVSEIAVHVGDHVTAGQTLARLTYDRTALQDNVNAAQITVNHAQTGLNTAETNLSQQRQQSTTALAVAYDQEQQALKICDNPGAAPNCKDLARNNYRLAQQQASAAVSSSRQGVTNAQNSLDQANQQLQSAQHNLDTANNNAVIKAPADAVVTSINGTVGQLIGSSSSSSSSSSPFIALSDLSSLSVTTQVSEADIAHVQVGQPAQFTVSAYPSQTFHATVASVNLNGQTSSSNVVSYDVHLAIDLGSLNGTHLYPGMTATANITVDQRIDALLVPNSAFSFLNTALQAGELDRNALASVLGGSRNPGSSQSPGGSKGNGNGNAAGSAQTHTRVVLELRHGTLTPVVVTTGLTDGAQTEVLSGLHAGDQVVVGQTGGNTSNQPNNAPGGGPGGEPGGGPVQVIKGGQ
ncbi:MAG: efflux RND transporter periplasmic adaptor subunit [Chloroflexota bacterium]|nr:efflux RND transporter periplasmic adaptor subunit [Chloroflexota bacterium]